MSKTELSRFELGRIVCPTGKLLIVDAGYLDMWCHDRDPVVPRRALSSDDAARRANAALDYEIVGPDAERAGLLFDRQWHPRFLFDIPEGGEEPLAAKFAEIIGAHGLHASIQRLPKRVSHRRRVDLALERGRGAGEIQMHGVPAVAIGDVPAGELRVHGEPMPNGDPDELRMRRVVVACRDLPVERSERVGLVGIDWARLIVADVDALGLWKHHAPLDGKADFAFWGRDAERVAEKFAANRIEDNAFGWKDLDVDDAEKRVDEVRSFIERNKLLAATDYRPHSHHYVLMQQVRASERFYGSGEVVLGDARACGFQTSWGDGLFEVHRDLDASGRLVSIRIEMGTPERQRLMRRVLTQALVSKLVADGTEPARFMYREPPDNAHDSGWRIVSGVEPEGYNDDPKNIAVVRLADLRDPKVDALLDEPVGSVFERVPGAEDFVRVTDWQPTEH
jgi:hypothetical protein